MCELYIFLLKSFVCLPVFLINANYYRSDVKYIERNTNRTIFVLIAYVC